VNDETGGVRQFHRFTSKLPRQAVTAGACDTCDNAVHAHQGPVAARTYAFPLREVAAAFVAVGTGASYYRAADRARASASRRQLPGEWGGATVAEWLDVFGPPLLAEYAETAWPETLVLDSTRFMVENVRTGTQRLAFNVLGAYGYPAKGRGRVWALHAAHSARAVEWELLLRSLDTTVPPRLVITDGAVEIRNAVRAVWPELPGPSFPRPFVARCEHHLHANGVEAMHADGWGGWDSFLRRRLDTAFRREEGWAELHDKAGGFVTTEAWLRGIADVRTQVAVRHLLPAHHSTAALDAALGRVRDFLDSRSFVLRNAARTNVLLGLIRNHLNGCDVEAQYRIHLRDCVDARGGHAQVQRAAYDPRIDPRFPGRQMRYPGSLRA
jgi:hypothetical protein